jgi:hypothetical protein
MTGNGAGVPGDGSAAGKMPFDTSVAHQARMYDYVLGGKDNYASDRAAVEAGLKVWPDMAFAMRANRAFLGRAVRYLAGEAGMRQFLDIGTGIPTAGNTHEIVQAIAPESRVVYVDYDPVVLAHARALLVSNDVGATAYIDADLRDTDVILAKAAELLDFSQPVASTLLAILRTIQQQYTLRSREQVARFFAGMDLIAPGLVPVEEWRPDPAMANAGTSAVYGAVGRKR